MILFASLAWTLWNKVRKIAIEHRFRSNSIQILTSSIAYAEMDSVTESY